MKCPLRVVIYMRRVYIPIVNTYYGGTLVLSTLCKFLRELGCDARLLIIPFFPRNRISRFRFVSNCIVKNTKYLLNYFFRKYTTKINKNKSSASILNVEGIRIQWYPYFNKNNSIIIYPEIIYGNPLGAKNVARWLLYHYNYKYQKGAYSEQDLFFAYREVFNDLDLNPMNHIITVRYFDSKLYRQYNFEERTGNCYIIQKGKDRTDLPREYDGPVFNYNMSQEEIVEMLNTCKYCYCYDTQTFYLKIAAVCGCIPILMMEPGKTEEDYLSNNEQHYGIAYGNTPEQIEYAISTRKKCLQELDFFNSNIINARKLVTILNEKWA